MATYKREFGQFSGQLDVNIRVSDRILDFFLPILLGAAFVFGLAYASSVGIGWFSKKVAQFASMLTNVLGINLF
jgi:hypothetical protein